MNQDNRPKLVKKYIGPKLPTASVSISGYLPSGVVVGQGSSLIIDDSMSQHLDRIIYDIGSSILDSPTLGDFIDYDHLDF